MDSKRGTGLYLLASIAIAAVGAGVALFIAVATGGGLAGGTTTLAFRWFVPLLAAAVIGVVAALLLDERPGSSSSVNELRPSVCAACGSPIIDEWKLCPHCGALLECDMRLHSGRAASGNVEG